MQHFYSTIPSSATKWIMIAIWPNKRITKTAKQKIVYEPYIDIWSQDKYTKTYTVLKKVWYSGNKAWIPISILYKIRRYLNKNKSKNSNGKMTKYTLSNNDENQEKWIFLCHQEKRIEYCTSTLNKNLTYDWL